MGADRRPAQRGGAVAAQGGRTYRRRDNDVLAGPAALWRTATGLAFQPGILGGLACYAISVVVWIVALSRVEVSIAYPMLSIGYVVNAALAWWLFGEQLNAQRWLGIAVIIVGVVLVGRSGSTQ